MNAITADALKVLGVLLDHVGPATFALARQLVDTLHKASTGEITETDVASELESIRAHLAANDATADEALRAKFQT